MKRTNWIIAAACVFCLTGVAAAELRMPSIFGANMVLQRDKPARVWGWADADENVTVTFAGQTKTAKAGKDGKWTVTLGAMKASTAGKPLTVQGKTGKLTLANVVVGELWLFARQSTIDISLANADHTVVPNSPNVRYFAITPSARPTPQDDFPPEGDLSGGRIFDFPIEIKPPELAGSPAGPWRACKGQDAGGLSGAAFYFARDLQAKLGVPVGVIDLAMAHSIVGSWISKEAQQAAGTNDSAFLKGLPAGGALDDWDKAAAMTKYNEDLAKWHRNLANKHRTGESTNIIKPAVPINPGYRLLLQSGCYNACILPMGQMAMRGVLIYQGANYPYFSYRRLGADFDPNAAANAYYASYTYKKFLRYGITNRNFTALIGDWRRTFADDALAFGILQPCGSGTDRHTRDVLSSKMARFREVQDQVCRQTKGAGLIVTFDLAQHGSRQPRDEAEVGRRCLAWADANVYGGKGTVGSGPVYDSMSIKGNRVTLRFKSGTAARMRSRNGELVGFTVGEKYEDVSGKSRTRFVPAAAKILDDGMIQVWSDEMPAPTAARYAWSTVPAGNLVSGEALPAAPFRTDDWPEDLEPFGDLDADFQKPMSEWGEPAQLLYGQKVAIDTLGPTGLRGYTLGRNVIIGAIEPGSPADGIVKIDDAIIAAGGTMFGHDPRHVLGDAIDASQRPENKGLLRLKLVRAGDVKEVTLPLEVMGRFSDTAPFDCAKSAKIADDARAYLLEQLGPDAAAGLNGAHAGLMLLSSGEPAHLDAVRRIARRIILGAMKLKPAGESSPWNWHPAYEAIFLAEYYLATGDANVIPALKRYALFFGYTQDDVLGAWSHHGAPGQHNYGYAGAAKGRVNSVGTACFVAWTLIRECGLRVDPKKFKMAEDFFRRQTVDGVLGYGAESIKRLADSYPPEDFGKGLLPGCNGKATAAAVAFELIEPGNTTTAQCAAVAADSWTRRERGHGGEFFSYIWGPIGASLGERGAFINFLAKQRWYYALCRRWDHGFSCQYGGGDSVKYLRYGPEIATGGYALAYAIPEKRLRVMGAAPSVFGRDLPAALAKAKRLYDAKRYADCIKATRTLLADKDLPTETAALAEQLLAAAWKMDASIRLTLARIHGDVAAADLYMARARLAALEPILPAGDTRCAAAKATVADPANAAVLDAGKTYYKHAGKVLTTGVRYVEAVSVNDDARRAMTSLASQATAGVYAKRSARLLADNPSETGDGGDWTALLPQNTHPWRLFCAEREELLPAGWKAPNFDDSSWYKTTFPNAWWLDHWAVLRTKFTLADKSQYAKLRLAMRFEFCLDTEVFLNGVKIARCERGVCGEPSILLGEKQRALLRTGENTLIVKALNWYRWNGITMHPFKVRLEGQ